MGRGPSQRRQYAREQGQGSMEYIGSIAAVVVVVGLVAALLASPSLRGQVVERTQALVCEVVGDPGCGPASADGGRSGQGPGDQGSGDEGSGDEGSGDEADGSGEEGCSGFWGCAWSGVKQVGSGVYNVGKGAVDDVVGIVDLVRNPGAIVDAAKYIWDNPGEALRQMVWDDESGGTWDRGDYGGAVGRTIWNVGSWFIPGVNVGKAAGKFGKLGKLTRVVDDLVDLGKLADDAAAAARRAEDLAARGDLDGAARAAQEARAKADEAADAARKAGCPIAARLPGQTMDGTALAVGGVSGDSALGGGGPVLSVALVPVVMDRVLAAGPDCDAAQDAAKKADEEADAAEAAVRNAGPGQWGPAGESMSERAAAYQEQITGAAPNTTYRVDGVKFDGYTDGVLLDAKGPGYARFIKNGEFQPWYQGADDLVEQAERQLRVAGDTPIRWSVAEAEAATAIQELLASRGITGIEIVHVPAR